MKDQGKAEVGKLEKVKDGEVEKENYGRSENETDDTQIAIKTATSPSRTIPMKKLTRQK